MSCLAGQRCLVLTVEYFCVLNALAVAEYLLNAAQCVLMGQSPNRLKQNASFGLVLDVQ